MPATTSETSNDDAAAAYVDLGAASSGADSHPPDVRCEPQVCKYHPGQIAHKASSFPRLTEITASLNVISAIAMDLL